MNNDTIQNKEQAKRDLRNAVRGTQEILASATTVFPFTLFPDTITVDREKISVTQRFFFQIAEVISIRIEDILSITADVGPFFGSLKISTRFFNPEKPYSVNYLWRQDALTLKRLIQGYTIAIQKSIDCSMLSTHELRTTLDKLGQAAPNEEV